MAFDNLCGNRKPQTCSLDIFIFMLLQAVKTLGQPFQICRCDGNAVVGNTDFNGGASGYIIIMMGGNCLYFAVDTDTVVSGVAYLTALSIRFCRT